jgi:predicted permease
MEALLQDLKYATRQLLRSPGFALVAMLTLAVGIGANTALFSLATAILARPLPEIASPQGLVWITPVDSRAGHPLMLSYPDFLDYRDSTQAFSEASAIAHVDFAISTGGEPARVRGMLVSGDYFRMLGVRFSLGRGFLPEEDAVSAANSATVISYRLWQERFGGDPKVIGRRMTIDGLPFVVVGVAPQRFNGTEHSEPRDVWVPISLAGTRLPGFVNFLKSRDTWWLTSVGRLAPGVSIERANAALTTVAARIAKTDTAEHAFVTARAFAVRGGLGPTDGNDVAPVAVLAFAVTLLVLLIACANVSNLLLGRAVARRREIAVRLSIGAARRRVIRQLLTESVLLAMCGTVTGSILASWATDVVASIIPAPIDVSPNASVLWFTIGIAFLTGVAFGVVPALSATRADITSVLKEAAIGFDRSRARLQRGFVVAQVSLSLVLLVTAGMFLGALYKSTRTDVHFDASDRVLAASFSLELNGYTPERGAAFLDELQTRVMALPGVQSATFTNQVPMGERHIGADIKVQGDAAATRRFGESTGLEVYESTIRPDYFKTIGIPVARGRDFTRDDRVGSEPVAMVSEDFARAAFPNEDALGKRVSTNGDRGPFMTIVGVAREAQTYGLNERRRPIIYLPQTQRPKVLDLTLLVRHPGGAIQLAPALRRMIGAMDHNLPVYDVQTLAQYRYDRGAESRLGSTLLAIFGGLALLLATIGVYAVMAFSVNERTREIGVRVALGAARVQIVAMFVREGWRLAAIGVVIGIALSAGVAKLLASAFLGLRMSDAIVFALGAGLLSFAVLAACWIPARRAAGVDPMIALRGE